ncbi:alkaline phosphatase D family protein [Gemmatimonas groenlandica]|uniref:Alkaline phosphatase n=1 Tax=Gemmatimonas groenlandica TaxID=2732249 RepID=A0A6M4IMR1_9BACT|nr:alkaline phosphatase D family protein [Gemmatimonas groenlandica]QJR35375.1 alkaline phosphatase [Gemmatimonas groenlandica]
MSETPLSRRRFVQGTLAAGAAMFVPDTRLWLPTDGAPAIVPSARQRPVMVNGVQSGDPLSDRAILWSRTDRAARLHVEWDTSERFTNVRRLRSPVAVAESAYTTHLDLTALPAGQDIWYRVRYESERAPRVFSEPIIGHLRTAPHPSARGGHRVRVAWSGDMVGQGWGIDESRGGIRMYDALRRAEPDVFVHSGDNIYADQPLLPEVPLDDGTMWRNLVVDGKRKVAETLEEYRGAFAYNLLDANARQFGASVPMIAQWDDHEVVDNWFHDLVLENDPRYTEKRVRVLAERAKQAFFEFLPIRRHRRDAGRVYRQFRYGPLLELFVVDLRSYRGANSGNRQRTASSETAMFGAEQLAWLSRAMRESRAVWKVVACDMPIGLIVPDRVRNGERNFEAIANSDDGVPSGRELEVARLLQQLQQAKVRNVVWVTADVHYAAAHHYAPERAQFTHFDAFWEFVAGPMHAGTFGPNVLDASFGPEVRFASTAPKPNRPPSDNLQFYGTLDVDASTHALTAGLWDVTGKRLWQVELPVAEPSR